MKPEILPKSNGHLLCEYHNTYWCIDIEDFVKSGADAELVWMNYPDETMIEVPIIPTSNLWASVWLRKPDAAPVQMYRVGFQQEDNVETVFMGFLHVGEGRSVMRNMILDWFSGTQDIENLVCQSRGHGYKENKRWEHDKKYPALYMAQLWSVWRTRNCLSCTFDAASNKDLVPDAGPTASPWR